tara:strand:+ start:41 stop:766 length:726 start_codon:yes stop_codon:yes gene_type:complete
MSAPAVILVEPQMGENIGMAARAMLNCGMTDLRLVNPRQGWPNGKAIQTSSNAKSVIDAVQVFESTADAIADLNYVIATTSRPRHMNKVIHTPETAATEIHKRVANQQKSGFLFGPERAGLENDDISRAQAVIHVPLNPDYASLNLAQAVLLIGYQWFSQSDQEKLASSEAQNIPAAQKELDFTLNYLERELDKRGFFLNPDKKNHTLRNLRSMFTRGDLSSQECQTLNGIIKVLTTREPV